jgi:general L-amino acid transport system ATP-binding protein
MSDVSPVMPEVVTDREIDTSQMTVSKTEVAIEIIGMNKWYADFHVLRDINLKVMKGERIVIAGPSGSGKSTLIRCINRLEEHQQGQIIVNGTEPPRTSSASTRCAAKSAWCSSTSTCSRT